MHILNMAVVTASAALLVTLGMNGREILDWFRQKHLEHKQRVFFKIYTYLRARGYVLTRHPYPEHDKIYWVGPKDAEENGGA